MNQLKINDNSLIKKENFSCIKKLVSKIADKTLEQLEQESLFVFTNILKNTEDLSNNQMIIKSLSDYYCTENVLGFIGYGDERLVIKSRFSDDKDFFFQYLLKKVFKFQNFLKLETNSDFSNSLFNFLLFLFPNYLNKAMRKGLFKKYINNKYNDENIKGVIDIDRHIKKNIPFDGKVAYNQREFSYDNNLMELVRHTIEFIKRKPYGNCLLIKVKNEVKKVIDATYNYKKEDKQKIIEWNKKNSIHHAFYHEYCLLQRICLLILRYRGHNIGSGFKRIYGILFDGAWLWEEYVNLLIDDYFYHPKNKAGIGAQRLFCNNIGLIYPDFISRDFNPRKIADAKYKPYTNIGNQDYLQILAYMYRFDAKIGYFLYPESDNTEDKQLLLNSGTTFDNNVKPRNDIRVIKHGLKIPKNVKDYETFESLMKINEQEFIEIFKTMLC